MNKEIKNGPTLHGGVRTELIYADNKGKPVEKAKASRVEIIEYKSDGKVAFRSYGVFGPNKTEQ